MGTLIFIPDMPGISHPNILRKEIDTRSQVRDVAKDPVPLLSHRSLILFGVALEIKPRAPYMQDKCATAESYPNPDPLDVFLFVFAGHSWQYLGGLSSGSVLSSPSCSVQGILCSAKD